MKKYSADFHIQGHFGRYFASENTLAKLFREMQKMGCVLYDGCIEEVTEWDKTATEGHQYCRGGITITKGQPQMTAYTSL